MRHAPTHLALPVAFALACVGCASPETLDSTPVRVLAAVPGLTWVDGDPAAGTTTVVSLPLLTYRSSEERPGWFDSSTWVLPVVGRFAQTDRFVRLEWEGAPQGPGDDPLLGPDARPEPRRSGVTSAGPRADRERGRDRDRARGRGGVTLADPRQEPPARVRGGVTNAGPRVREPRVRPLGDPMSSDAGDARARAGALGEGSAAPPPGAVRSDGDRSHLVLRLPRPGKIVRQRPLQRTEWDLLGSLFRHHTTRPAEVVVELAPERGSGRRKAVYELGEAQDELRFLPLFSYERSASRTDWVAWPLLGLGYVREGERRALRLFYFLKIPLQ